MIDVQTQASSTAMAARLARAVPAGIHAYIAHVQATANVPERDRYSVSQFVPVSASPARESQLATVGVVTFVAVLVLWCGAELVVFSLIRDFRTATDHLKDGDALDRLSDSGPLAPRAR